MDVMPVLGFLPLFLIVAAMYASVGHGGASGYLALFAILGAASARIVPAVLVLNVLVAAIGFWQFRRAGYFRPSLLLPFVVASIPAAYVGGMIDIGRETFTLLLGAALLFSAWRIVVFRGADVEAHPPQGGALWLRALPVGAVLGFLAGLIGIGGGSRRMGRDKALLHVDGESFAERAAGVLACLTDEVLISAGTGKTERFEALMPSGKFRIVEDLLPDHGSLGGLHAAFHATDAAALLVLACDLPYVTEETLRPLFAFDSVGIVVALNDGNGVQPLAALWPRDVLPGLERYLDMGRRSARDFLRLVRLCVMDASGSGRSPLTNINTPGDYHRFVHSNSRVYVAGTISPCGVNEQRKIKRVT